MARTPLPGTDMSVIIVVSTSKNDVPFDVNIVSFALIAFISSSVMVTTICLPSALAVLAVDSRTDSLP
jgi:hypothetical protein